MIKQNVPKEIEQMNVIAF